MLLRRGLKETARYFLHYWQPQRIRGLHNFKSIPNFLKKKAFETILGIAAFNPEKFEFIDSDSHDQHDLKIIKAIMKKLFPALIVRAKVLTGEASEVIISEITQCLELWSEGKGLRYPDPELKLSYIDAACSLLEAVTYLETFYIDLVRKICDTAKQIIPDPYEKGYHRYADILSQDERYHRQAEIMIQFRQKEISAPSYKAGERVEALLFLHPIAARFDQQMTERIFGEARMAAREWESNVEGLAFALLKTASRAQEEFDFQDEHLVKLSNVFKWLKQVAFGDADIPLQGERER
jgi:hypothetical protein